MRFQIEYLAETTEEDSVCFAEPERFATLDAAGDHAFDQAAWAFETHGAEGFQVRDMLDNGRIVALEAY